jgi:hypothetical protein
VEEQRGVGSDHDAMGIYSVGRASLVLLALLQSPEEDADESITLGWLSKCLWVDGERYRSEGITGGLSE